MLLECLQRNISNYRRRGMKDMIPELQLSYRGLIVHLCPAPGTRLWAPVGLPGWLADAGRHFHIPSFPHHHWAALMKELKMANKKFSFYKSQINVNLNSVITPFPPFGLGRTYRNYSGGSLNLQSNFAKVIWNLKNAHSPWPPGNLLFETIKGIWKVASAKFFTKVIIRTVKNVKPPWCPTNTVLTCSIFVSTLCDSIKITSNDT